MVYLGAAILVVGFIAVLKLLKLVEKANEVVGASRHSLEIMRSKEMDDAAKEKAMQATAKKLFGLFFLLTTGMGLALVVPAGIVWLLDGVGVLSFDAVIAFTLSWEFIAVTTVLLLAVIIFAKRKKPDHEFENRYSAVDRMLHQIAFKVTTPQLALADMEDTMFRKEIDQADGSRPVFIAGLPRGGTTLVLNMCHSLSEFASHRYRDMPFLLTPMLWNRFSRNFQQQDEVRERAHGDGMMVSADSPEALEEMIWKVFWKDRYGEDRIHPWPVGKKREFEDFFSRHMRKICALRRMETDVPARYVSKNNLNIAKIDYLHDTFDDAVFIIPFMHPLRHAEDLLRQHRNFLAIHKDDEFARAFMEGIGHYDFGANIRPIDFDGWLDRRTHRNYEDMNFWLEYWITAYEYLLSRAGGRIHLHSHEALCEDPATSLKHLAEIIGINDTAAFLDNEKVIWKTPPPEVGTEGLDPDLVERAEGLYRRMRDASHT